jgi:penicillin amidase
MRRVLLKVFVAFVILAGVLTLGAYGYLRRSLPQLDGTISAAGISAPVDIVRDADAITHVFGATKLDVYYGLGYAHAQDRLWQMEFQRRVGMARLSEVFGQPTVATDRFLRTLGTGRAARSAWESLPAQTKTELNAYVAGVNAFISTHHGGELPLEFTVLRFEPEPWTGPDVLAWVKMMAWDLGKNYSMEVLRHDVVAALGAQKAADLFQPYPADGLTILNAADMPWMATKPTASFVARPFQGRVRGAESPALHDQQDLSVLHSSVVESWSNAFATGVSIPGLGSALGSNNWVVDGTMTASGKPLLANDPHLDAQIPSLWYLAHLSAGDFDVVGATLPGAPAVVIGRNKFIAWGETSVMSDVQDLYRERLDVAGSSAEFRGAREPLRIIDETIGVKGAAPIAIRVRISRHGPLISDAINANNAESARLPKPAPLDPLAFRWTALDRQDSTVTSILRLNEARNWNDFTAALRDFIVPSQNFVYADVDGHIGYYAPGHFPIRSGGDGSMPADGWTGDAEWAGWVPFDELPHAYDPPEHLIVSANERVAPPSYTRIAGEWIDPYRAQRIIDRLREKPKLTVDDFASIQADTFSLHAKRLLPILLERVHPIDAQDAQAVSILRQWNLDARGDQAAPAIFQAWYYELLPAVAGDELGPVLTPDYQGLDQSSYRSRFLLRTLAEKDNAWCDDARTPAKETCDDTASIALHAGIARLRKQAGSDMTRWRWDGVHHGVFAHSTLDTVPLLGRWLRRTVPHGGDWSTVDAGPVYAPKPFEQHSLPGYRQIADLSPANDNRFLDAVGQSGHVLSPHYDDALPLWAAGRQRKMRMDRAKIERDAIGRLRLTPGNK